MNINQKIEKVRAEKGITKKHIADQFCKSATWYGSVAKGEIRIKAEDIPKFADVLGVNVNYFFD
ncbi:hypothetical protein BMT55_11745 [Listeria newyorkensis]|uniref:HTH cro/C1-type domain-containing protein n=1 Tax=Listeria newyorkensis TaxID=1497681 RepID=A0ABX4XKY8_9LIST|nr:helix-turn-helix transcriptional regulator [Listeria newyorkensis]PNP90644.1 hypothetical protein BMT55_11745 [Listeria newyorkensis]